MRYRRSKQFIQANQNDINKFVGLKTKRRGKDENFFRFTIDEHDARMIVANVRKKDLNKFASYVQRNRFAPFRALQQYEIDKKKGLW